ncbi:BatA domain-containing protein [Balneolaceae bacterium ANBcel3]|nr:BatA domain-containing protein [Balneolaceae bacterium ANBcel3]
MSFLNPLLFIALAAAAIPVIIHLIQFHRPQKIFFSTLVFFQDLQKTTIRRLNLKRYVLLAMRILAISMLALVLARPFLQSELAGRMGGHNQHAIIAIMVDNGPSLYQIDESGPYMEQSKRAALEIVRQASDESRFLINTTHGFDDAGRIMRKAEAKRVIEQIEVVNRGAYPAEALRFLYQRMEDEPGLDGRIYWITDGRQTQLEKMTDRVSPEFFDERPYPLTVVRVGEDSFQNMGISSIQTGQTLSGVGVSSTIEVNVKNYGDQAIHQAYLSLEIEEDRIGQYEFSLEPGEESGFLFDVIPEQSGTIKGRAILEGGLYTFDHVRYLALEVPEQRRILVVTDRGEDGSRMSYLVPAVRAISETMAGMESVHIDVSDLRDEVLSEYHAMIMDGVRRIPEYIQPELIEFIQQGRSLLLLPSEQSSPDSYNYFLSQLQGGAFTGMRGSYGRFNEIATLETFQEGHELTDGLFLDEEENIRVDMPALYHYWMYDQAEAPGRTILRSNLNEPLLMEHRFGDGLVLVSAFGFSPGWSNISIKPIYSPILYRIIRHVVSWEYGDLRKHTLGSPFERYLASGGTQFILKLNEDEYYPEVQLSARGARLSYPGVEWEPGWLHIENEDMRHIIAINQDISESDFRSLSNEEIQNILISSEVPAAGVLSVSGLNEAELKSAVTSASFGREIWTFFIWLALAFLVLECIISIGHKNKPSTVD